jgi:hypothetical protein
MPQRDEYQTEYFNQPENRLSTSNHDEQIHGEQEQDDSRLLLLHKAK